MPARKYFGTDGIRGEVGRAPITPDFVLRLGWALGKAVTSGSPGRGRVIIGKDTRVSGYMLESALEAGLSAAGVDISLIGPMPTPGIAYLTRTSRASAGIVISASHNPYYDNGIKFFSPDGMKLAEQTERQIEQLLGCELESVGSADLGKAERFSDAAGRYIEFCKHSVPDRFSLRGLKVAVDCANGATYQILPRVLYELGADLEVIGDEPDGFNINEQCGSTSVAALVDLVRGSAADVGIAVDGDGDRVVMVDGDGRLVDGDGILFVIADHLLKRGEFPGGVVGTLMTNLGLEKKLGDMGIPFERTRVGDRYVLTRLLEKGWKLGGETSGHILCLDKHSTGDGIIAALQVLLAMVDRGQPLEQLTGALTIFPQKLVNVRLDGNGGIDPAKVIDAGPVRDAVARAQAALGDSGRIVLRPSGTEPLLRVMVEGRDEQQVATFSREIADAVSAAL